MQASAPTAAAAQFSRGSARKGKPAAVAPAGLRWPGLGAPSLRCTRSGGSTTAASRSTNTWEQRQQGRAGVQTATRPGARQAAWQQHHSPRSESAPFRTLTKTQLRIRVGTTVYSQWQVNAAQPTRNLGNTTRPANLGLHRRDIQCGADGLRRHKICKAASQGPTGERKALPGGRQAGGGGGQQRAAPRHDPTAHRDLLDPRLTPALLIERGNREQLLQRPAKRLQRLQLEHPWCGGRARKLDDLGAHFQHLSRTAGEAVRSGGPRGRNNRRQSVGDSRPSRKRP